MLRAFRRSAPPDEFWTWLASHAQDLQRRFRDDPDGIAVEIDRHFGRSFRGLCWEVLPEDEGPWTFCVSADGDRRRFARVREAVHAASRVPGWTVRAFRPRGSLDSTIELAGCQLGADDLWWSARPHDDGVAITLWVRGLTPDDDALLSAALVLLHNAIGEHDAAVKVRDVARERLPDHPEALPHLAPLRDLPGFLDGLAEGPAIQLERTRRPDG